MIAAYKNDPRSVANAELVDKHNHIRWVLAPGEEFVTPLEYRDELTVLPNSGATVYIAYANNSTDFETVSA